MMNQEEIMALMAKMNEESSQGEMGGSTVKPVAFPPIQRPAGRLAIKATLGHFEDITMDIFVELGQTKLKVKDLLKLDVGSVIELNKSAGEAVDVYINGKSIAKGEVLVINDNFSVRLSKISRPGAGKKPKPVEEGT